ncbi:MAG: ribose 5-phosphate isomerase B [Aureliella sp.]
MNQFLIKTLAIGGDHAGFEMKSMLVEFLRGHNLMVLDCGTTDESACDFTDFAEKVGVEVISGAVQRGILVCGSGVGVSVAANKIPGVRASLCHDTYSAHQGVEHDDMNILCIGARVIGPELAMEIVRSFLSALYAPQPRHQRRVDKLLDLERRALAGQFTSQVRNDPLR